MCTQKDLQSNWVRRLPCRFCNVYNSKWLIFLKFKCSLLGSFVSLYVQSYCNHQLSNKYISIFSLLFVYSSFPVGKCKEFVFSAVLIRGDGVKIFLWLFFFFVAGVSDSETKIRFFAYIFLPFNDCWLLLFLLLSVFYHKIYVLARAKSNVNFIPFVFRFSGVHKMVCWLLIAGFTISNYTILF